MSEILSTTTGILVVIAYFFAVCGLAYLARVSADIRKARRMAAAKADMANGLRSLNYIEHYNGGMVQYGWNNNVPVASIFNAYQGAELGCNEIYIVKTNGRVRKYANERDAYNGMLEMLVLDERDNTLNICSLMKGGK